MIERFTEESEKIVRTDRRPIEVYIIVAIWIASIAIGALVFFNLD